MYSRDQRVRSYRRSWKKIIFSAAAVLLLAAAAGYVLTMRWYNTNLRPVNEGATEIMQVKIEPGSSARQVGQLLHERGLIRSQAAFGWYLRLNNLRGSLQAGDHRLSPSQSVVEIVESLGEGRSAAVNFTIPSGKRLDELKKIFKEAGFDDQQIEMAFDPSTYTDHQIASYKPADASLEGYIYPETFQIAESTTATEVVTKSLDQLILKLTPDLIEKLKAQGLSVHEAIILASIVEKEVANPDDMSKVAQVFLKRLSTGMELGSDPTFFYAAAVFGGRASPSLDNPYNTRLYSGLPPGPIGNSTIEALKALANPADTDHLYFVAGDDGVTRFNKTFEEHDRDAALYCIELCKLP